MTSYSKPTNQEVDKAIPLLSSPQHEIYFFSRLENPNWIGPLAKRGVFKHPPKAEHVNGGVRFPGWPPGQYLARMAAKAPAEVAAVFKTIETDNPSVVGDMIDAALAMPADKAACLIPSISEAARKGRLWIYFKDATDLSLRLAEAGRSHAALTLAEAMFAPTFENTQQEPSERDIFWYKEGLKKVVPVLAGSIAHEFLPSLCDWLNASVKAKNIVDPRSDYPYLWRPAIEEHEQNPDYDFAGVMVGFVRAGFEHAIRSGNLSLDVALEIVQRYAHVIFKRIRLHLIGEFAQQNARVACDTILNRELFDDYQYKHEYAMLAGRRLGLLSPEQRNEWFAWIDAGPDMSDFEQSMKSLGRAVPTEDDRRNWINHWQLEKLHWVRDWLTGAQQDYYKRMLAEFGEPELADMHVHVSSGFTGDDTPITVEELTAMTFEQVVHAVSSWRPERSRFTGPSIEGLGLAFQEYVAKNPEEFSAHARILVDQPANFIRHFIRQMAEAIKAGRPINVSAVLDLCDWVVERPIDERTTARQEYERLVDQNWQWTRDEISRFIQQVCAARTEDVPRYSLDSFRQRMRHLIASLCQDTAQSYILHDTGRDDPRLHDYLGFAINSPRGKAVEAALEYARWVANHIKKSEGKQETIPGGFTGMPEVREMLEWQIAPENRTSEALAVIGSRIGLVFWIDKEWLAQNGARLFRLEDIERGPGLAHGWAAWNAFLVWVRPHIEFYRIFKLQFASAVQHAAKVQLAQRNEHQPMYHLGEHLIMLYGRGQLSLDDDDCLFRRFIANANPEVRRHAIGFVGQTLAGVEQIPAKIIDRFQTLWDLYWGGPGRKDAEESPNAALFGTWFSSGKFPPRWALERLEQFVAVNPRPQPSHMIGERLAEIAEWDPLESTCRHASLSIL